MNYQIVVVKFIKDFTSFFPRRIWWFLVKIQMKYY